MFALISGKEVSFSTIPAKDQLTFWPFTFTFFSVKFST